MSTVDSYISAFGCFAKCVIEKRYDDVIECFDEFFRQLTEVIDSRILLTELLAPELINIEDSVRDLAERSLESFKGLVPIWVEEFKEHIKKDVLIPAIKAVAEKYQLPLSDAEKKRCRDAWSGSQSPEEFSPLANGVTLYLLGLNRCEPSPAGFVQAAEVLGTANNIDRRCQPFSTAPYGNNFPWDQVFRPFVDHDQTMAHCEVMAERLTLDAVGFAGDSKWPRCVIAVHNPGERAVRVNRIEVVAKRFWELPSDGGQLFPEGDADCAVGLSLTSQVPYQSSVELSIEVGADLERALIVRLQPYPSEESSLLRASAYAVLADITLRYGDRKILRADKNLLFLIGLGLGVSGWDENARQFKLQSDADAFQRKKRAVMEMGTIDAYVEGRLERSIEFILDFARRNGI